MYRLERRDWVALLAVAAALIAVYYHGVSEFGVYEDDYVNAVRGINITGSELVNLLRSWVTDWPRARPLSNGSVLTFSFVLYRIGGLTALYLIPFTAVLLNSALLFMIVAPRLGRYAGFTSALVFALLPTDTLRLCIHISPEVHYAIAFLLLGTLAYHSGRRWLCYVCLAVGLLFHEGSTLSFLFIPVLAGMSGRQNWRVYARHLLLCAAAGSAVLALRTFLVNDARTKSVLGDPLALAERMAAGVWYGSTTHLMLLGMRARDTAKMINPGWALLVLAIAALMFGAYLLWGRQRAADSRVWLRMMVFAICTATVPYMAYVTDPYWPSNHTAGRMGHVHSSPGVGVAIGAGTAAALLTMTEKARAIRLAAAGAMSLYFGLLLGWGHVVEQQYREAWRNQRQFWQALLPQISDAGDRTIILVEHKTQVDFPFTWVIFSNSWADSIVLRNLFRYPAEWNREPRVFYNSTDWKQAVRQDGGRILWEMPAGEWPTATVELEPRNVIVVEPRAGKPVRVDGVVATAAGPLELKRIPPAGEPAYPKRPFYSDLIGPSSTH